MAGKPIHLTRRKKIVSSNNLPTKPPMPSKDRSIYKFFNDLTNGKLIDSKKSEHNMDHIDRMSFDQFCSNFRRKKIMEAIMQENNQKQIAHDPATRKMLMAYRLHLRRLRDEHGI
jgi:hypothetical protein